MAPWDSPLTRAWTKTSIYVLPGPNPLTSFGSQPLDHHTAQVRTGLPGRLVIGPEGIRPGQPLEFTLRQGLRQGIGGHLIHPAHGLHGNHDAVVGQYVGV